MANEKVAVLCKNEQEWEDTKLKAGKSGIMNWRTARHYNDICVYVYDEHKGCDPQEACIRNGYEIITADQYKGPTSRRMDKKIAVLCKTGTEWDAVKAKANLPSVADWGAVSHYGDICIYLDRHNGFDRRDDCLRNNYEVLTASEYLHPPRRTIKERAVLCETKEEWNAVRRRARKRTQDVPDWDGLNHYNQKCIYVDTGEGFDQKSDCVNRGCKIVSAEEYLKPVKKRGALGIDFNNIVAKIPTKEEVVKPESESKWKPIDTAPKNRYIMVRGDSGMLTYPKFYTVAIFNPEYRDDWINIHNDRLTDSGYVPEEWMEIPV